jgi:hypothetical protein
MHKHVRRDAEISKFETLILEGHVTRRHALAELIEPSLDMGDKGKKRR